MAGIPSGVPGTLMNRFGVAAFSCSALASSTVLFVSWASFGDTSSDTQPSRPPVASKIAAEQARRLREVGERKLEEQVLAHGAGRQEGTDLLVVVGAAGERLVEDRRVRRQAR